MSRITALMRLSVLLLGCAGFGVLAAAEKAVDVRVLIDVSGSMKQNDPHNLRAPALRLLVGLMPEGARSGVWTFGRYVNMQVKHGTVNANWKELARNESQKIHSRGLFTNIEDALKKATNDWRTANAKQRRNLILLTDGMVDIAKDKKVNQASRQRILNELLPRLKKAGVTIHAIALSAGVDKDLLGKLTAETNGWYEQVDDAATLERAFLKLFEKSAPVDTLPLKDNRFTVDSSINDMTVLIFRKAETPVELITPKGEVWSSATHSANARWHQEQSYDLITVKKPSAGEWGVKGSRDPDNRVMVVTNLNLVVNELPSNILAGDSVPVEAQLHEKGARITRRHFLNLVKFDIKTGGDEIIALNDDGVTPDQKENDGIYSVNPWDKLAEGEHTLLIRAKGATFERESRHVIRIHHSAVDVRLDENKEKHDFYMSIVPHVQIIVPDSIKVKIQVEDGEHIEVNQDTGGIWIASIDNKYKDKFAQIEISGQRHNGEAVNINLKRKITLAQETTASSVVATKHESKQDATEGHEDKASEPEEKETNWMLISWLVAMINIFLAVLGVLGFKFWKKKRAQALAVEEEEIAL